MASSIEEVVLECLEFQPRHGGLVVDQLESASGRLVYRRSAGWILELCEDFVHIRRVGWRGVYKAAAVELFRHAGEERVTPEELEAVQAAEQQARKAFREQQDAEVVAEFEAAFDSILPEYVDAPEITVAAE